MPSPRPRVVLAVLIGAQALGVASASVVAVALPPLGRDLGASGTDLQWVVDAFILVFASLMVAGGVAGDRRGRRGTFLLGLSAFSLGSLLCAIAPTVDALIAGRVVQGVGPALVLPSSLAILAAAFPSPQARARAIGVWAAGSGVGLASGPTLGGVLVDVLGWRAVFAVNVPLGVLLLVAGWRVLPRIAPRPSPHRFDVAGAVLVTVGVAALAFAIIEGRELGWTSPVVLAVVAASLCAFGALVAVERRHPEPLLDLALLRRPAFVGANLVGGAMFFALIGATIYFAAYLQQVQGRSPLEAGFCLLPLGAATGLAAPLSGRLTARYAPRGPMLLGIAIAFVATLLLLRLEPTTSVGEMWWVFALIGTGVGIALPPATVAALDAVQPERAGLASAIHNATRQLGQMLGVAVLGTVILASATEAAETGERLTGAAATAWVDGLHAALWVNAGVLLAVALVVARLVPATRSGDRS